MTVAGGADRRLALRHRHGADRRRAASGRPRPGTVSDPQPAHPRHARDRALRRRLADLAARSPTAATAARSPRSRSADERAPATRSGPDAGATPGARSDAELLRAHVDGDPRRLRRALRPAPRPALGGRAAHHGQPRGRRRRPPGRPGRGVPPGRLVPRRRRGHHLAAPGRRQRLPRPAACGPKVRRAEPLPDDLDEYARPRLAPPRPTAGRRRPGRASAWPRERRRAVLDALATLPAEQRAALVLVDMEGYPVAEVGRDPGLRRRDREVALLARPGPAGRCCSASCADAAVTRATPTRGTPRRRRPSDPRRPRAPRRPRRHRRRALGA